MERASENGSSLLEVIAVRWLLHPRIQAKILLTGFALCLFIILAVISFTRAARVGASDSPRENSPAGDWRGESLCLVKPSACHDEDSLYHFTRIADKPGRFSLQADKIVDGKPVTMGTVECDYDVARRALECNMGNAILKFDVRGNLMRGTMTLPNGTLWRKISLKRVPGK